MKKRIFALASAVVIIAIMVITQQNAKNAITGTATADGFGGKDAITVSVTVKDGKLTAVTAQGPNETPGIGSKAIESMPAEMLAKNSINVDGVTGATFSSKGILAAAEKAIVAAGLNPVDFGGGKANTPEPSPIPEVASEPQVEVSEPQVEIGLDGSVTGIAIADGFGGPGALKVSITLKDGKIAEVKAEGPKETDGIGSVAVARMPGEMVAANSIKVDGVSGATVTSTGLLKAAEEALKAAGVNPEDYKKAVAVKVEDKEYDADVAVIGAGGAGMIAAIVAADSGKKVVLIEKQAMVGGNSVRATGGMNATHTTLQDANRFTEDAGVEKTLNAAAKWKDDAYISDLAKTVKEQWEAYKQDPKGYFDSVELMELDTIIGGHGINDPELVKTFANNTASAIDWLKTIDIDLSSVGAFGGASVKRIHRPLNDNKQVISVGAYMIPKLEKAVKARSNITLLTETTATSLETDEGGNISGVLAESKGAKVTVKAKAVVIATGGFGANLRMVARLKPELDGFMTTNAPGINGDGITIAQELGAAVVDMKEIQIHPTVQADTSALITEGLRGDGAILVNSEGKRFIDETGTRDVVSAAEISQPGSFSWLIVDQKMADASSVIKGYISRGYAIQGDSYEDLARELNIPADVFAKTMNDWNKYVAERKDHDFNRTSFAQALDKAPYYAIKVTAGIHHTMGGLKVDAKSHVLKADGTVIPGLYAAGEVTGGLHGGNRLGGNAVADFVVFGRIAGQEAANF